MDCFFSDFQVRGNKKYRDRYQLIGTTVGGREIKVIFQPQGGQCGQNNYGMAVMKSKMRARKEPISEEGIDEIVEAQAENDSAWGRPIRVRKARPASLSIPGDLAARAAFLARLHREEKLDDWLTRVIKERVEVEEGAFIEAKREISARGM